MNTVASKGMKGKILDYFYGTDNGFGDSITCGARTNEVKHMPKTLAPINQSSKRTGLLSSRIRFGPLLRIVMLNSVLEGLGPQVNSHIYKHLLCKPCCLV